MIGITGEALNRGRSNRADADSPRIIGASLVRNRTLYVNGDIPLGGADGKLYFTGGVQDRFAAAYKLADTVLLRGSASRRGEHFQREADRAGSERDRQRVQVRERAVWLERHVVLCALVAQVLSRRTADSHTGV